MPNQDKNRAKQRLAGIAPHTPPATPTSTQTQTSFQPPDRPNKEIINLPTPPPTPDGFVVDPPATPIRSSNDFTPSIEDMTISVLPRPTQTFRPSVYNVHGEYGGLIPVNYFRWPLRAEGGSEINLGGELLTTSNGRWEIGETLLRHRLAGSMTTGAMAKLQWMARWLCAMESSALDVGYDSEGWTECCRKTWAAFMSEELNAPGRGQVLGASLDRELRKYGRVTPLGSVHVVQKGDARNYEAVDNSLHTPALIQHRSVYAVSNGMYPRGFTDIQSGRVVEMHPIHGPLHHQLPAQDEQQIAMNIRRDCNSLCTIIDVCTSVIKILADGQINNKMKSRPEPFLPLSRESALAHYVKYPIEDHVQSVPPINTTLVSIEGEPVWTSTKKVAELQELLVKDLVWPKRHVGESGHGLI
jgi:hypothetical protein